MESAQIDLTDKASLQRGAALYMSYCSGCHAISYHRYTRLADDLGLTAEQVEQNLIYNDQKIGENINTGMRTDDGLAWFGKAPPDLSVEARAKAQGADWIYNYPTSFYVDEARPSGWNNTVFPGASMPHVLWELQGIQHAKTEPKHKNAKGEAESCHMGEYKGECIIGFELAEQDLLLRGPGDLVGSRQSGAPPMYLADLLRDASVVAEARRDALALFERDPLLADPQLARLRQLIQKRWGETLGLARIG